MTQDLTLPLNQDFAEYKKGKEKQIRIMMLQQIENEPNLEAKRRREESGLKGTNV